LQTFSTLREGLQAAAEVARTAAVARERASAAHDLLGIADFAEIDPHRWSEQLIHLKSEQTLLERTSEELRTLRDQLRAIETAIEAGEKELRQIDGDHAVCQNRIDTNRRLAEGRENQLKEFPAYKHDVAEAGFAEVAGTVPPVTLDNVEQLAHQTGQTLQGKISYEQRRVNDASEKMIAGMSEFLGQFPEFGQTLSVGRYISKAISRRLLRPVAHCVKNSG
jgi:uncharacterized protein YPO0396